MYSLCFLIFKVQNDFCFAVVDNAFSVLAVIKSKEVVKVLRCTYGRAAVTANDFEDFKHKFCGKMIARATDELPTLVDIDGFFNRSVFLCFIPNVVKCHKHTYGK